MQPSPESLERERVLALLQRHGWNATSFQTLESDFRYWFHGDDACVAYVDTGAAWVAAGAPLAPAERLADTARAFVEAAAAQGRRACFFGTEARFSRQYRCATLLIGEQPVWDPSRWADVLRSSRSLREQLRRARAKGVIARAVSPAELEDASGPLRQKVEGVIARWASSRPMALMGFLVQLEPFSFPRERRYFVAEAGGAVVGFLSAVPVYARRGLFLEDLLRDPAAPNGTAELLVDQAMRTAAAEGCAYVTLGLAPLAGPVASGLRAARRLGARLYDFRGLYAFKAKLRPGRWEPIDLAVPPGGHGLLAIHDVLAAFARGGLLRFGVATLLRGPAVVFELLGVLLVPWTALLALAPAARWFPSPAVKWAWVAFDVGLALAMLRLSRRPSPSLLLLLATLVTCDAALTLLQAVLFNAPRVRGALDAAIVAVAVAAPTVAALLLWSARLHAPARRARADGARGGRRVSPSRGAAASRTSP
ncbi:hypothetical protein SOCEGT47_057460 [Sorangium cellulosum]|uniref:N-acetyltransferase domain-containing protein n=1 Tax=Sorangium cellulosum TaxID=56 RepID=A0A4V0NE76_SORCE|nr:DUF2156 domain-containing protein [Sorangium cellulosum]AUX25202.1 hypothetical protein SOCEGT47_057460 [Sorangium cellulosum]